MSLTRVKAQFRTESTHPRLGEDGIGGLAGGARVGLVPNLGFGCLGGKNGASSGGSWRCSSLVSPSGLFGGPDHPVWRFSAG